MFIKPFDAKELSGNTFIEGEVTGIIDNVILEKSQTSGDPMITLHNKVWDINQNELQVRDYIPLTERMRWKLAQLFKAINKQDILKEGFHSEDLPLLLKDCAFKCITKLEANPKSPDKKFIKIKYYIENDNQGLLTTEPNFNDDLPFI